MNTVLFLLSLTIAIIGPLVAISYLRPILVRVLRSLCDADGGAEFWIRSAYLLAVCGTLLLMLSFGEFSEGASLVETLRRALWLVFAGVFISVAIISRQVWGQIRPMLGSTTASSGPQPIPRPAASPMAASAAWPDDGARS